MIELQELSKIYTMGDIQVHALRRINLCIEQGESVAIMGPSGSGKSTMMNMLGCLDRPSEGSWLLDGVEIGKMTDDELAEIRNQAIGFVFQNFNLLNKASALTNVEMPLMYRGISRSKRMEMAKEALAIVGLQDRMEHTPMELSGGQQQRVAIARALVGKPRIILADEPTGNLDTRSGLEVMAILQELNAQGMTLIMVTHDNNIADHCRRIVRLRDGRIFANETNSNWVSAKVTLGKLPLVAEEDELTGAEAVPTPLPGSTDLSSNQPNTK
ncbi:MAG: ABC transporter ATP-binding protein [Symbiobacteriaceae bacterium]|nr:ABC transporter ATP-binding protein [Symbiobacteriaceae bacterium]